MSDIIIPRNNGLLNFLTLDNIGYVYSKRFLSVEKDSGDLLSIQVYNANPEKPVSTLDVRAMQEFIHRYCHSTSVIRYDGYTLELFTGEYTGYSDKAENQFIELIQEEILRTSNGHKEHQYIFKPFKMSVMPFTCNNGKIVKIKTRERSLPDVRLQ